MTCRGAAATGPDGSALSGACDQQVSKEPIMADKDKSAKGAAKPGKDAPKQAPKKK